MKLVWDAGMGSDGLFRLTGRDDCGNIEFSIGVEIGGLRDVQAIILRYSRRKIFPDDVLLTHSEVLGEGPWYCYLCSENEGYPCSGNNREKEEFLMGIAQNHLAVLKT